jgi:hypothetical protein
MDILAAVLGCLIGVGCGILLLWVFAKLKTKMDLLLDSVNGAEGRLTHLINKDAKKLDDLKADTALNQKNIMLIEENLKLKIRQKEIDELVDLILDTVADDTEFIRSSFFQKLGSLTEYEVINRQIISYQNRISSIIEAVKEAKKTNVSKE